MAIIDQVIAKSPVTVTWNFHTAAKVLIAADGRSATLRNGKAKMQLSIASPSDGKFKIVPANPPQPQKQNPGVSNLVIELPGVTSTTIQVIASADGSAGEPLGPPRKMGGVREDREVLADAVLVEIALSLLREAASNTR